MKTGTGASSGSWQEAGVRSATSWSEKGWRGPGPASASLGVEGLGATRSTQGAALANRSLVDRHGCRGRPDLVSRRINLPLTPSPAASAQSGSCAMRSADSDRGHDRQHPPRVSWVAFVPEGGDRSVISGRSYPGKRSLQLAMFGFPVVGRNQGVPVPFSPKVAVAGLSENSHLLSFKITKSLLSLERQLF